MENHRGLINWAIACAEHVLELLPDRNIDILLIQALEIAKEWKRGDVGTGTAMEAAWQTHTVARGCDDPVLKAIFRSIAEAVSTAHMADHSLGASLYALIKTCRLSEKSV